MRANVRIISKMKNRKAFNIFKALGVFLVLIAICVSGALIFHNYYYELIYVSGSSMSPTLNGSDSESEGTKVDFGIVDNHSSAKKNIKRFSIVSTYYPDDRDYDLSTNTLRKSAKKKIKRVIALPNETFKIEKGYLYVMKDGEFQLVNYSFETNPSVETNFTEKDMGPLTLGEKEYWVLGDNRAASRDCYSIGKPITYENIFGVLVAIEGKGSLYIKHYQCEYCGRTYKNESDVCEHYGAYVKPSPVYDIKNKQYHWPKFF